MTLRYSSYADPNGAPADTWQKMLQQAGALEDMGPDQAQMASQMPEEPPIMVSGQPPQPNPLPTMPTEVESQQPRQPAATGNKGDAEMALQNLTKQYNIASQDYINKQNLGIQDLEKGVNEAANMSPDIDWRPLAAFYGMPVDAFSKPESKSERSNRILKLKEGIQGARKGLSQEGLAALKAQIDAYKASKDNSLDNELKKSTIFKNYSDAGIRKDKADESKPDQSKAATFANRMEQAESVFNSLEKRGFNPSDKKNAIAQSVLYPEIFKPENVKVLEQAQRNFINATLRRESGSAISPSEFDSGKKQYFPQVGDGPEVLAQKAENRRIVREGLAREGSKAYHPYVAKDNDGHVPTFEEFKKMRSEGKIK